MRGRTEQTLEATAASMPAMVSTSRSSVAAILTNAASEFFGSNVAESIFLGVVHREQRHVGSEGSELLGLVRGRVAHTGVHRDVLAWMPRGTEGGHSKHEIN